MEEKGIEWVCPNCLRKKTEEDLGKGKSSSQASPAKQKAKVESISDSVVPQAVPSSKEVPPAV